MKLMHIPCKYPVNIINTQYVVRILDITVSDEDKIEPILVDIIQERAGRSNCSCVKCEKKDIPQNELGLICVKCGTLVPITEVWSLKPEWYILCQDCYGPLVIRMYPAEVRPPAEPVKLKFR